MTQKQKLDISLPNLCIALQPCTSLCSFFGTIVSWGQKVASKSGNHLVLDLALNHNNAI